MAQTIRFPDDLKAEAIGYAEGLGISLNALCAVALRDYLDARKRDYAKTAATLQRASRSHAVDGTRLDKSLAVIRSSQSLNSPCACGSGLKYKRCHGAGDAARQG